MILQQDFFDTGSTLQSQHVRNSSTVTVLYLKELARIVTLFTRTLY